MLTCWLVPHARVLGGHQGKSGEQGGGGSQGMQKGYGQSMSFLAYFLTMFSSPKRKSDLLTVKQFCRTGMGLYRAIVRALWALVCLKAPGDPPAGAAGPCRLRFWSEPPSPEPSLPATASPKRAILEENTQVS